MLLLRLMLLLLLAVVVVVLLLVVCSCCCCYSYCQVRRSSRPLTGVAALRSCVAHCVSMGRKES